MTTEWVLPDLCDAYGDAVSVLELELRTFGGRRSFGGPIRTVRCFEDNSRVAECVDMPGEGAVLVVDGGGSRRCALLGDNLAEKAARNAWSGVIVYGCVRDVAALEQIDLDRVEPGLAVFPCIDPWNPHVSFFRSRIRGVGRVGIAGRAALSG